MSAFAVAGQLYLVRSLSKSVVFDTKGKSTGAVEYTAELQGNMGYQPVEITKELFDKVQVGKSYILTLNLEVPEEANVEITIEEAY